MRILGIQPEEIVVILEMRMSELDKLQRAIGLGEINYDGQDKEQAEAVAFLNEVFNPMLIKLLEDNGYDA